MNEFANVEVLRNDKAPREQAELLFNQDGGFLINDKKFLYHRSVEALAIIFGVSTDFSVLAADLKSQCCLIKGTAEYKNKKFYATGEVHPGNNSFPFFAAVAEKRAIDRVVLKALGLHGYYYSESEKDDRTTKDISNAGTNTISNDTEKAVFIENALNKVTHIGNFSALITEHLSFLKDLETKSPKIFETLKTKIMDKKQQLHKGEANNG